MAASPNIKTVELAYPHIVKKDDEPARLFLRRQKSDVASGMNKRFHLLFFLSCLIGTQLSGDDSLWNLYESKLKASQVCGFDAYDYAVDSCMVGIRSIEVYPCDQSRNETTLCVRQGRV